MSKYHLGEFEEVVMLTVAILNGKAYRLSIVNEIENRLSRSVSMGSLQVVLKRLEEKGYLKSELGEATKMRGGKKKRYFAITSTGKSILEETKEKRLQLWSAIPDVGLS